MKSMILLFSLLFLPVSSAFAQDMQYVSSKSGDTLVVKDDIEYGFGMNNLYFLMQSDSLAPATRVYFLKAGGIYSCWNNPQSSKIYRTIIMGPEQNLKTGSPTMPPPIISGFGPADFGSSGGMTVNKDLLVKNVDLEMGNDYDGCRGWAWFNFGGDSLKLQVDNCIMEHTWWTWVGGPPAMQTIKFTNDYFVNLNGHSCRNNGGVVDFNSGSAFQQDTLLVENCTHVNTQGTLYKFRNGYTVNRAIFNHNNFIDCAGYVIMNNGDQTNLSITNNIYVNTQLQAYDSKNYPTDAYDPYAGLPMGFVNLVPDSTFTTNVGNHGVYADRNLAYWDTSLSNIVSTLNTNQVNGSTEWVSQMITMNTRTEALFADKTTYPLLTNGKWISKKPTFANADVLFGSQLGILKAYAIACVNTGYATPMPSWRQLSNPEVLHFVHADWPIPIDLSYTDADLLTAGLGGFPIGDLGWLPTQYASWKAQESLELAYIDSILTGKITVGVQTAPQSPQKFQLQNNYPNPFNPSTVINYTIAKDGNVTLKVYNLLGQEVATLVNGFQTANSYYVDFNASGLSSGVYIYELRSGSNVITKKMVLMK